MLPTQAKLFLLQSCQQGSFLISCSICSIIPNSLWLRDPSFLPIFSLGVCSPGRCGSSCLRMAVPVWCPDGCSHHGAISPAGAMSLLCPRCSPKAWSPPPPPLCSPPGLLLVNKPQLCKPLQSSLLHLHKPCITQPQGLGNTPSVQGRPCHTFSWAREPQGQGPPVIMAVGG